MSLSLNRFCRIAFCFVICFFFASTVLILNQEILAQDDSSSDPLSEQTEEEARQRKIIERYLMIVEKNPRKGTALDRVYGYHIEQGTLDEFTKELKKKASGTDEDGSSWIILGLIQAKRGNDPEAVEAFINAEKVSDNEPLIPYYLSQSLVMTGQSDKAIEALERAIKKKPQKNYLLNIFKSLGKLHQLANRHEEAMEVWARLEKLFPENLRVQEQIAIYLDEDAQFEQAMARYEKLSENATDEYQKVVFKMKAAELKLRMGQNEKAIADFEKMMTELKPGSWLHRDVRNRIEKIYMRTQDFSGLSDYYESWIKKNPEDIDAISRYGTVLSKQGRSPEALEQFRKAIELAPSTVQFRKDLISELIYKEKISEAVKEYEKLNEVKPGDLEIVRDWGLLVLENREVPEEDRQAEVIKIWGEFEKGVSKDAVILSQIADWYRQAELTEKAIELYKKSIELSPGSPQYYEYLGEYYHQLKRKEDALNTWKRLIDGENRTARNLIRLAEVLGGFGYKEEALVYWEEAAKKNLDFPEYVRHAQLLREAKQFKEALAELEKAKEIADRQEDHNRVLQEQILCYQESGTLKEEIAELEKTIEEKEQDRDKNLARLALYHEAAGDLKKAIESITTSLEINEKNVSTLSTAARLYESAGDLLTAVRTYETLLDADRKYKAEYLNKIASIQMQLGQTDKSLETAKELIAASPGNPEAYQFYAELCFMIGKQDEGIDTLRKAVRANPTDLDILHSLAGVLAEQFKTDEAIEIYWQTFNKADDLSNRLDIIAKLTELYVRMNRNDELMDRLERIRSNQKDKREINLCIAQAQRSTGDYGSARLTLEEMLVDNPKDTQLLQQLVSLSENEDNLEAAIKYQKSLNDISPSKDGKFHLARLYMVKGEDEEAEKIWSELMEKEDDPENIMQSVDSLIGKKSYELAAEQLNKALYAEPDNWDLKYRKLVLGILLDKKEDVLKTCREIMDLGVDHEELSHQYKQQMQRIMKLKQSQPSRYRYYEPYPSFYQRQTAVQSIRGLKQNHEQMVTQMQSRSSYGGVAFSAGFVVHGSSSRYSNPTFWIPMDFGGLKVAAITLLYDDAKSKNQEEQFVEKFRKKIEKPDASNREWKDWGYLNLASNDHRTNGFKNVIHSLEVVSKRSTLPYKALFLLSLTASGRVDFNTNTPQERVSKDKEPYDKERLDYIVSCYREILKSKPDWIQLNFLLVSIGELNRAGRNDESDQLFKETIEAANTPQLIQKGIQMAMVQKEGESMLKLIRKYDSLNQNQYSYAQQYLHQFLQFLNQGDVKDQDKLTRQLMEISLESIAKQHLNKTYNRTTTRSLSGSFQQNMHVAIYGPNNNTNHVQIDYPFVNSHLNQSAIQLLRNCYELCSKEMKVSGIVVYKNDLKIKELIGMIEKFESDDIEQKLNMKMALAAIYWWLNDKDQAMSTIKDAVAGYEDNTNLKLEYAQLLFRQNGKEEALEVLDSIEVLDYNILKEREMLALQLSIQANNVERAKQAAEKLFGMRLDNNSQIQLASVMHQLGLNEMGDAVLARIRRSAGNNINTLGQLMGKYQQQGKNEVASEIAMQIIRSHGSSSRNNRNNNDHYYQSAIQVLTQAGHLKKLIEVTERQLELSPKSTRIMSTLLSYYSAAGEQEKIKSLQKKLLDVQANNPQLIYQMARTAASGNNHKYASDLFLIVLEKNPQLLVNDFYQVTRSFQNDKRRDELIDKLLTMDLKVFRHYHYLMDLINNSSSSSASEAEKASSIKLLKKLMEDYPQEKMNMLGNLYRQEMWDNPELYKIVKDTILDEKTELKSNPWYGLDRIMSYSSHGKVNGMATRLMDMADKQNKKEELIKIISQRVKEEEKWLGGKGLLAMLYLREKKTDEAEKIIRELQEEQSNKMNPQARWLLAQELHDFEKLHPLAIELYEANEEFNNSNNQMQFQYRSTRSLMELYIKRKQNEKAVAILKRVEEEPPRQQHNPSYTAYQNINNLQEIARRYTEIGYHHETMRILASLLENDSLFSTAQQYGGSNMKKQVEQNYENAVKKIDGNVIALILKEQLKNSEESSKADSDNEPGKQSGDKEESTSDEKKEKQEKKVESPYPFDFIWIINPGESLTDQVVESTFLSIFSKNKVEKETKKEIKELLEKLRKQSGEEKSTSLFEIMLSHYMDQSKFKQDELDEARDMLVSEINSWKIAAETEKIDRGSAQARALIEKKKINYILSLWTLSRIASENPETREWGSSLALETYEIAKEHLQEKWVLAMINELALRELKAGNREKAEQNWDRMLEMILTPGAEGKKVSLLKNKQEQLIARSEATTRAAGYFLSNVRKFFNESLPLIATGQLPVQAADEVVTAPVETKKDENEKEEKKKPILIRVEQFEKAMQIAKIAATNDMVDLSLKAVRESLSHGTPVPGNTINVGTTIYSGGVVVSTSNTGVNPTTTLVEKHVDELNKIWKEKKFPADKVTETLISVVFPEDRPQEILLYQKPFIHVSTQSGARIADSQSIAKLLIEWAIESDQIRDVTDLAQKRLKNYPGNTESILFVTELALLKKDFKLANDQLDKLNNLVSSNNVMQVNQLVCQVAFPALKIQETSETALKVIQKAIDNMSNGNQVEPVSSYLLILAVNQMLHSKEKEAYASLQKYLTTNQKQNQRYSGDYGFYLRRKQLISASEILIHSSLFKETLEYIGELSDIRVRDYGPAPIDNIVTTMSRKIRDLPLKERYETLKNWIFPQNRKDKIREIAASTPIETPPDFFFKDGKSDRSITNLENELNDPSSYFFSTSYELVDCAKKLNKLPELNKLISQNYKNVTGNELSNRNRIELLMLIADGKIEEAQNKIELLISAVKAVIPNVTKGTQTLDSNKTAELAVVIACLDIPELQDSARELNQLLEKSAFRFSIRNLMVQTRYIEYLFDILKQKKSLARSTNLDNWVPVNHKIIKLDFGGSSHPVWVRQSGYISHLAGSDIDYLFFKYPLTGEFKYSVETMNYRWTEGHLSYNGLSYHVEGQHLRGEVWAMGRHGSVVLPAQTLAYNKFNQVEVDVKPGSFQYLINGTKFHEDPDAGQISPWVALFCENACKSYFRNFQLSGNPKIPSELKLTEGSRMEGWIASFYGDDIRIRESAFKNPDNPENPPVNKAQPVWTSEGGVLHGRRTSDDPHFHSSQSLLYYCRPLQPEEKLTYEFLYEPGKTQTHPTLGRLAFLLENEGIRLHWLTASQDYDWSGLFSDNSVEVNGFQKTEGKLPLREGEWNSMEIDYQEDQVRLSLNDQLVYEIPSHYFKQTLFGFFHYKDLTDSKVRNVVLTGNWPHELSSEEVIKLVNNTNFSSPESSTEIAESLIAEDFVADHAPGILKFSKTLSPDEKYQFLKNWVVPNSQHSTFRLYPNTNKQPNTPQSEENEPAPEYLDSPAMELVRVAQELGKLDELKSSLKTLSSKDKNFEFTRHAFLVLVNVAQENDKEAFEHLESFKEHLKTVNKDTPVWHRWPEVVAIREAMGRPALKDQCSELYSLIAAQQMPEKSIDFDCVRDPQVWFQALDSLKLKEPVASR